MISGLYDGSVTHARTEPRHRFTYRLMLPLVDVDRIPETFNGASGWGTGWWHPARFRAADYLRPHEARELVAGQTGAATDGAVFLLAHLRTFGRCFNPLTLHFCHDSEGGLTGTVATVTNTPWGERSHYVIPPDGRLNATKAGHVSPFQPMGVEYEVRLKQRLGRIDLRIDVEREGVALLRTSMNLIRRDLTPAARRAALCRPRFHSLRTSAAIYLEAARLKQRGAEFHAHPRKAA